LIVERKASFYYLSQLELEIRYAHQAQQLEELSEELHGCFRRIEALERDNRRMSEMLQQLSPDFEQSPDE
jgi:uncharacterized coiled-coil protein SlyX